VISLLVIVNPDERVVGGLQSLYGRDLLTDLKACCESGNAGAAFTNLILQDKLAPLWGGYRAWF